MNGIAFGVIITGATIWAVSTLGVMTLGLAARRKDPRIVMDDPWEQPEVAARWRELERSADLAEEASPARPKGPSVPRSAA
jgi:hypothetical protein